MGDHRAEFSKRLADAMRAMRWEPRAHVLLARFNSRYRGRSVAFLTVSRWLNGDAIPRRDKLDVLSEILRVEPQFLLYGEKARHVREPRMVWPDRVAPRDQALFEDFLALPAKQRDVVRNLVEALAESAPRKSKSD
jgi:transcriptional regulator with XRE-family HTH domain